MNKKIKELAKKHNIPEDLLKEAMALETDKVTKANRQLVPKLVNLIARYAESSDT